MNRIRRAYRAMFFKDDDDNTPQGKLTRGCFYLVYWFIGLLVLFGAIVPAFHIFILGEKP